MMSKIRLITLFVAAFVILCPALTQATDAILTEDFEDNALDSRIHVETIGDVTNPSPGIKDITESGSQKAFGFGRSVCGANCWDGFVTKLIIQFPSPTYVSYLSLKEIELFGNWGSEGYIFVDGIGLQEYCGPYTQDFGRCPVNDWQADTTFRTKSVLINKVVETIELRSWDITNVSEIFIDDLQVFGAIDLTNGLVAYWSFDNCDATDDSGNGHNGTIYGNPQCVDGEKGKALSFDGQDDYVEVPNDPSLNPPTVSVSAWFNVDQFGPPESCKWQSLVFKESPLPADNHYYAINLGSWEGWQGLLCANTYLTWGTLSSVCSIQPIQLQKWYHVAATYDSTGIKEYINGVLQGSSPTDAPLPAGNKSLFIGYTGMWCGWYWNGIIDDVRIYNRVLSEAEIQALYEGTSGGDSDTDGLPDDWEQQYFGDLVQNPNDDYDHDELTNLQEYQLGTDPTKWDTDGDGVNDGTEVANGTNPLIPDVTLEPNISVNPLSLYFGEFDVGKGCLAEQSFTILNTGNADLTVSEITLSDYNNFHLSITALLCQKSYTPGESCIFTVSFCPTSGGIRMTALSITSNDPDAPKVEGQLSGRRLIPADYITKIYEATESIYFMNCNENVTNEKRIPLILIHGIHGSQDSDKNKRLDEMEKLDAADYWSKFAGKFCNDDILKNKYKVYLFSYLSDIFSVKEIARSLRNDLDDYIRQKKIEDTQFVILAHSMGGLVARSYMKQHSHAVGNYEGKKGGERTTLITLATPHHGTPMACSQSRDALAKNANARDRNYIKNWWGGSNNWYTTLKTGSIYYWWFRLEQRVAYNNPNRKDLLWDNFDGIMTASNLDLNKWLSKELNVGTKYDNKLIVYYGYIDNYREDYLDIVRQIYTKKTSGGPNILLTGAYDNKNDEHKLLTYSSIMMTYGLSKNKYSPYAKNDGMVPKQSAAFDGHTVAKQVECPNHDHADMKFDIEGDKKCVNGKSLFEYVKDDLLNIH